MTGANHEERLPTGSDPARAMARAARVSEWEACRELAAAVGHDPELFDLLTRTDQEHLPGYVRIVDLAGRPAALALVVPRRVCIAETWVDGAVIALVGTHPDHRARGLARLLLEDTVSFVRSRGFRLAMLYGDPEFYGRLGFVPCLGNYATEIHLHGPDRGAGSGPWPSTRPPGRENGGTVSLWRPMTDADVAAAARLYSRAATRTSCAVMRPPIAWVWRPRRRATSLRVLQSGSEVTGYARILEDVADSPPELLVLQEMEVNGPPEAGKALDWLISQAAERGKTRVRFTGPPDHAFSRLAHLAVAARVTIRPASAGQVVITNRGLLIADIAPTLGRRAERAGLPSGTRLALDVGSKRMNLSYSAGSLSLLGGRAGREGEHPVTRLSIEVFTMIMTGYAGGGEIEGLPRTMVDPAHREPLAVLFPRGFPQWVPAPYW